MRFVLLVPTAVLLLASSSLASIASTAGEPKKSISKPTQLVPPATLAGLGVGELTLPGLADGSVVAQLYDHTGARQFLLKGVLVYAIPAGSELGGMQAVFHGALLAPGTALEVEGTWMISPEGKGVLAAVVFGVGEAGEQGPKIGKIVGAFTLPGIDTLSAGAAPQTIRYAIAKKQRAMKALRPQATVQPLEEDYIDPHLTGITMPLELRWKLVQ